MKSITPKNARWYSVFGLPVLMCVEYISALKVATSYKFLFIVFLSIKYSATVGFLPVTLLLLLVLLNVFNFSWLLDVFALYLTREAASDRPLWRKIA
ncbi:hypothetical protein AABF20_001292 [Klebsiella variicola]